MPATVRRIFAPSGNRDADYFQAVCPEHPSWISGTHSNRSVEGRSLADRDRDDHNAARHPTSAGEMTTPADALPEVAEADGVAVALRSGEKFRRVIGTLDPETVCSRHRDTPVVTAEFEWVREGIAGTRFQRLAHADGTPCEHPHSLSNGDNFPLFAYRVPTCPSCGARGEDLVTVTLEAYGDRATWSCCGHETWRSIGD